uniref:Protein translation factor SUI1 isogeny n=1 Tax=Rhizophora mucronata TaxID=61149 RepID=A0A2P2LMM7_RHIMU
MKLRVGNFGKWWKDRLCVLTYCKERKRRVPFLGLALFGKDRDWILCPKIAICHFSASLNFCSVSKWRYLYMDFSDNVLCSGSSIWRLCLLFLGQPCKDSDFTYMIAGQRWRKIIGHNPASLSVICVKIKTKKKSHH